MTRDQFLTEQMGLRWSIYTTEQNDFSTPEGFFKLWEWAKEQEWWNIFVLDAPGSPWIQTCFINPDRFADAVSRYLGWEEK